MKTHLIALIVMVLTIQIHAQTSKKQKEVTQNKLVLSPPNNLGYINTVSNEENSYSINKAQNIIGTFDITKSKVYENNFDTYQVIFKNIEGQIVATYDADGKLIHAFEKFKITQLPEAVSNVIKTEYPGWTIQSTVYRVNYYNRIKENNPVFKKVYNVQIVNHNKKLNIKVNAQGQILNNKKIIK